MAVASPPPAEADLPPLDPRRLELVAAVGVGLGFLLCYLATLPPGITFGGDCGELASAGAVLGVPHPTGYPLYCLLLHGACRLLFWWPPAIAGAALSAVAAAGTLALLALTVARASGERAAGIVTAACLGSTAALWSQAVIVEVYTVHLLLVAALLWAWTGWRHTGDQRYLAGAGALFGCGLAHHLSIVLTLPPLLLAVALERGPDPAARRLARAVARATPWALLPLLWYAYLPLRAAAEPAINWGQTDTWSGFLAHITGRSYGGLLLAVDLGTMGRYLVNNLLMAAVDLRWGAVVAPLGLLYLLRHDRPMAVLLLGWFALSLGFAVAYNVGDRLNYLLLGYLAAAVAAGWGAVAVRHWLQGRRPAEQRLAGDAVLTLIFVLLALLPSPPDGAAMLTAGWTRGSQRGNDRPARLADAALADVAPDGALLVLSDELAFACWYQQIVSGARRDVTVHALGQIDDDRGRQRAERTIERELARRAVHLAFWDDDLAGRYRLEPAPVTARLTAASAGLTGQPAGPAREWSEPNLRVAPGWVLAGGAVESPIRLTVGAEQILAVKPRTLASATVELAVEDGGEPLALAVWLVHQSLVPGSGSAGPRVLNEGTDTLAGFVRLTVELAPPGAGRWRWRVPVALPQLSLPGVYEVRVGLAEARLDPRGEEFWRATASLGQVVRFDR